MSTQCTVDRIIQPPNMLSNEHITDPRKSRSNAMSNECTDYGSSKLHYTAVTSLMKLNPIRDFLGVPLHKPFKMLFEIKLVIIINDEMQTSTVFIDEFYFFAFSFFYSKIKRKP